MIEARMQRVMGDVLGVAPSEVGAHSSVDTVERWDSIHHMTLLLALEQEFEIVFDDRDIPNLTSFAAIHAALQRLGAPCS